MSNPTSVTGPQFRDGMKNRQFVSPTYVSSFGNTIYPNAIASPNGNQKSPQVHQRSPQVISSGEKFVSGRSPRKNSNPRHLDADGARSHVSDNARSGSGSRNSPRSPGRLMPGLQRSPGSPSPGSSGQKSRGTFHAKTKINNFHGGVYIADVEDEEVQRDYDNRVRMDAENAALVEAKRKLKILEKKAHIESDNDHLQKVEEFNQKRSEDYQQMRAQTKDLKEFDKQIGESKKRTADLDRKHEKKLDGAIIKMDQKYFANLDTQKLREKLAAQEQHQHYLEHQVSSKIRESHTLAAQNATQASPLQNSLPIPPNPHPPPSAYKTILDTQLAIKNLETQKAAHQDSKTPHQGYQDYKKVFDKKYATKTQGTGTNTRKNTDNTFTTKTVTICNGDL